MIRVRANKLRIAAAQDVGGRRFDARATTRARLAPSASSHASSMTATRKLWLLKGGFLPCPVATRVK